MAKTRSTSTRNQNHDHASHRKRMTTCDNGDTAPWSDLNHDLLFLVMMQLGVIDFLSFKGVCKSWRLLALSNMKMFMASKSPMSVCISSHGTKKECYLEDFERRKFKTIIPHSAGRTCVGLTCGYLILFGVKTRDFWLVNPITRHELRFPFIPFPVSDYPSRTRVILVFSPSLSGWVFVVLKKFTNKIWFSVAGKREWNHVSATSPILDLHVFKGKIYTIDILCHLWELRLNSEPKLTLLKTKDFSELEVLHPEFLSLGENLCMMNFILKYPIKVRELNSDEMKWVSPEKTIREYAFFLSDLNHGVAIKPESWIGNRPQYERYVDFLDTNGKSQKGLLYFANMWYFPHECLNVNLID